MNKIVCCPNSRLPATLDPEITYFAMYSYVRPAREGVGYIAPTLPRAIRRDGLTPSEKVWDFTSIALAVAAVDKAFDRKETVDGWTRIFELDISLLQPDLWQTVRTEIESVLKYLTGDYWTLSFSAGGEVPAKTRKVKEIDADCVSLLSGGIDSLVGAIDLITAEKKPFFVSQVSRGDKTTQKRYAEALGGKNRHCQWSYTVKHPNVGEKSTRGRSIVFFAYAALAASAIQTPNNQPVEIVVPENGFISLNVPMGSGRLGSHSTKTTHPIYMAGIQSIWNAVGIPAKLSFPYRYKTKGELLVECADQGKLIDLISASVSCGKYGRHKLTHCGRCVPCLVRRAAFLKANLFDTTEKGYCSPQLKHAESNDVIAVATSYLRYKAKGIRRFSGGSLTFANTDEYADLENVVERGMDELGRLLNAHGVI